MKKIAYSIILVLVITPIQLSAGELSLGVGMNHSWLMYPNLPFPIENQFRPGYSISANSTHHLFQDAEMSIGLRLFTVGRHEDNEIDNYKVRVNHIYLSLPIKVGYQIIGNVYPFLAFEPGVQLHSDFEFTTPSGPNEQRTFTDEMRRLNLFAGFGLKYVFSVSERHLGLSGQFNFGLLRVSKDDRFDVTDDGYRYWEDWRTREVVIHAEYYFDI
jgi:hypothetical protein